MPTPSTYKTHRHCETARLQNIVLVLTTESGPAGDGTGDWAGWESPRLLWEPPS
jgi:hypothetical protein